MFIADLFEATTHNTVVILPGGFHPFHPGHLSLYKSAQQAFPKADIYYAATNDKTQRPFDFADKLALATIAGVPRGHFVQVTSPFRANEITDNYDPRTTVLIFARSEKDRGESPQPGLPNQIVTRGPRKGHAPYILAYNNNPKSMSHHAYMAYLPTKPFSAGASKITSATEIRNVWPTADDETKDTIVTDLYPRNPELARAILDKYLGAVHEDAAGVGVVAGKGQEKDPRYSMSLTKDVRPGQIRKNLKAFDLVEDQLSILDLQLDQLAGK
jgi:hypothetical protein